MDMDLKTASNRAAAPQAPLVEPVAPTPAADPFKADAPAPKAKRSAGGMLKKLLMFVVLLVLIGGAAGGTYYWQHKKVMATRAQVQGLNKQVTDLQGQVTTLTADNKKMMDAAAAVKTPTTDELVITAVTNYCQAQVDPTSAKALVYIQGTSGADKKKVLYSTDKKFAEVNAGCAATATTADTGKNYILKYSGTSWVVIDSGTQASATATKLFNIPTDFK